MKKLESMKKHYSNRIAGRYIFVKSILFSAVIWMIPLVVFAQNEGKKPGISFRVAQTVAWLIGLLIQMTFILPLGYLLSAIMSMMMELASFNVFIRSQAVALGWVMVRDIANLFFVIILLVIAFATILHIEAYNYKRLLPKLLIMALLINFSKTIAGVIVDFSQVIMNFFVDAFSDVGYGTFVDGLGLTQLMSLANPGSGATDNSPNALEIVAGFIMAAVMLAITTVVALIFLIVIVIRIVAFWILIILSPLAFLMAILPSTQTYWRRWWQEMGKYAAVGPVLGFFLWLGLAIMTSGNDIQTDFAAGNISWTEFYSPVKVFDLGLLSKYIVVIAFLLAGLKVTKDLGIAGQGLIGKVADRSKSFLTSWGKKSLKSSVLLPASVAGLLGNQADKWALKAIEKSKIARLPFIGRSIIQNIAKPILEYQEKKAAEGKAEAQFYKDHPELARALQAQIPFTPGARIKAEARKKLLPATLITDNQELARTIRGMNAEERNQLPREQAMAVVQRLIDTDFDVASDLLAIHIRNGNFARYLPQDERYSVNRYGNIQRWDPTLKNGEGDWQVVPEADVKELVHQIGQKITQGAITDFTVTGGRIEPAGIRHMFAGKRESDPKAPVFQEQLTHFLDSFPGDDKSDKKAVRQYIEEHWEEGMKSMQWADSSQLLNQDEFLKRFDQYESMTHMMDESGRYRGGIRLGGFGKRRQLKATDSIRVSYQDLNDHLSPEYQLKPLEPSTSIISDEAKEEYGRALADMLQERRASLAGAQSDDEIQKILQRLGRSTSPGKLKKRQAQVIEELSLAEKRLRDPEWLKNNPLQIDNSDVASGIHVKERKRHEAGHAILGELIAKGIDLSQVFASISQQIQDELRAQLQAEERATADEQTNIEEMLADYMGGRYEAARPRPAQRLKNLSQEARSRKPSRKPHQETLARFSGQAGPKEPEAVVSQARGVEEEWTIIQTINNNPQIHNIFQGLPAILGRGPQAWTPDTSALVLKMLKEALKQLKNIQASEISNLERMKKIGAGTAQQTDRIEQIATSQKRLGSLYDQLQAVARKEGEPITKQEIKIIQEVQRLVAPKAVGAAEDESLNKTT